MNLYLYSQIHICYIIIYIKNQARQIHTKKSCLKIHLVEKVFLFSFFFSLSWFLLKYDFDILIWFFISSPTVCVSVWREMEEGEGGRQGDRPIV